VLASATELRNTSRRVAHIFIWKHPLVIAAAQYCHRKSSFENGDLLGAGKCKRHSLFKTKKYVRAVHEKYSTGLKDAWPGSLEFNEAPVCSEASLHYALFRRGRQTYAHGAKLPANS
jgi:hypothetical protein